MEYAGRVILEQAAVGPFFKNGFVVGCEETSEAVLIDPGDEVDALLDAIARRKLAVQQILLTHAHLDHITGVGRAKAALGVPVWLHQDDNFLYERVLQQGLMFGIKVERQPPVDRFYEPGATLAFGSYRVRVLHTPGHCPGGVCLAIARDGEAQPTLFVGDTLFAGSIGRTDLPGGDMETLLRSIRDVLFAFPDDTVVWPGHGPQTTIGQERRTNPFLVG
jgi:glyoxylase-like metal-dependent hydrolase (beta-lactamase superfamily II)